jgi:wyosine [tRNA(Phe)-imidazoG37] synthetase (radical SAM superfamily)
MPEQMKPYIYGPVPSRRLGRSLGVDLVPFKTCTYDCIYCQLGRTTNKTLERKEWVPLDQVLRQIKTKLDLRPDFITLAGSGEPTLHSGIGDLIVRIKESTDVPVAVLTNGSLLWMPDVREALIPADLVVPSLDAGSSELFRYVNRPHADIVFGKMLEGLVKLREEYTGQYWLEVFLLSGVTTVEAQLNMLSHCIKLIEPDKVQLNTVTRPPAEEYAEAVPRERLEKIARQIGDGAEVIAAFPHEHAADSFESNRDDILNLLKRRPCSVQDIATGLGIHVNEAAKQVDRLVSEGRVKTRRHQGVLYCETAP